MCCGDERYEREEGGRASLTRRRMLRAMGVGAGVITLGGLIGCTSIESLIGLGPNQGEVSASSSSTSETAKSFAKFDKELLKELKKQVKEALKAQRRGDQYSAVSLTRQALERLFSHYDETGLTEGLEQEGYEGLKAFSEISQEVLQELKNMGFSKLEVRELKDRVLRSKQEMLSNRNVQVRKMMDLTLAKFKKLESRLNPSVETRAIVDAQGLLGCIGAILVAGGGAVVTGAACAACIAEPTRLSCIGCAGGVVVTTGAILVAFDAC